MYELNTEETQTIQDLITDMTKPRLPGAWRIVRTFETDDGEALVTFVPELDAHIIIIRTIVEGDEPYSRSSFEIA